MSLGVAVRHHLEDVAVDVDPTVDHFDLTRVGARDRVTLEQQGHGLEGIEVVHRHEVDVGTTGLRGPEEVPADAPESVDPNANCHLSAPLMHYCSSSYPESQGIGTIRPENPHWCQSPPDTASFPGARQGSRRPSSAAARRVVSWASPVGAARGAATTSGPPRASAPLIVAGS